MKVAIAIVGLLALLQAVTALPPAVLFHAAEDILIKTITRIVAIPKTHNYEVNLA